MVFSNRSTYKITESDPHILVASIADFLRFSLAYRILS